MSFNFLEKLFYGQSSNHNDFSVLAVDMHSHILPEIDDGAPDLGTSIELIKELMKLGYKHLIATPHVMFDIHPNTPKIIKEKLEIVRIEVAKQQLDVKIEAAAEYLLDDHFEDVLEQKNWLCINKKYILVELSFIAPPQNLESYIFQLRTKGLIPILAHPERYLYFGHQYGKYERLRDMGCLFQINLLSLSGYYGKDIKNNALKLLKKGWVEFLGTDCHSMNHIEFLNKGLRSKIFERTLSNISFYNSTLLS